MLFVSKMAAGVIGRLKKGEMVYDGWWISGKVSPNQAVFPAGIG